VFNSVTKCERQVLSMAIQFGCSMPMAATYYKSTAISNIHKKPSVVPGLDVLLPQIPSPHDPGNVYCTHGPPHPQGSPGSALPPIASLAAVCLRIDLYFFVHHLHAVSNAGHCLGMDRCSSIRLSCKAHLGLGSSYAVSSAPGRRGSGSLFVSPSLAGTCGGRVHEVELVCHS
jgi:hypothetical protein